jgi:hypothetical protein
VNKAVWGFSTLVVAGLLGLWFWLQGAQFFRFIFTDLRPAMPVILLFVAAIIGIFVVWVFMDSRNSAGSSITGTISVILAIAAIFLWVKLPYDTNRQYVDDVKLTAASAPSFEERSPFEVAARSSSRNLQNTTGAAQATKSLADQGDTGQWNTLVIRRGVNVGYESVQSINTPLYGTVPTSSVTLCKFNSDAQLRLGGWFPHNDLARSIYWTTPMDVNFSGNDVYSYCDGKTPYVVVPLKALEGFYAPQWKAYGVAVYNGSTGDLQIYTDSKDIAKIPGPVYPISLSQTQREAYTASGSWWEYIIGTAGYENTSKDADDPNGGNNSEFALRAASDGEVAYVTPLTPRGDSTTIVGLSTVDASVVKSGERNPVNIYTFENSKTRQANSSVADDIGTKYSWMPEFASTKVQIFEIVPGENGSWVASIGREQSVIYRAVIDVDRTITLYNSAGDVVTQANPGGTVAEDGTMTPTEPSVVGDLDSMTPEELQALGEQILQKLAEKATAAK